MEPHTHCGFLFEDQEVRKTHFPFSENDACQLMLLLALLPNFKIFYAWKKYVFSLNIVFKINQMNLSLIVLAHFHSHMRANFFSDSNSILEVKTISCLMGVIPKLDFFSLAFLQIFLIWRGWESFFRNCSLLFMSPTALHIQYYACKYVEISVFFNENLPVKVGMPTGKIFVLIFQ